MIKNYSIKVFYRDNDINSSLIESSLFNFFRTLEKKTRLFFFYILFSITFFQFNALQAQVSNEGVLYIGDNSTFYIGSENFNFSLGSTTLNRSKIDYGVMSFSNEARWIGASDSNFVDGYAQTESSTAFILPIGQSGVYAPIQVIPFSSDGVDAAYYRSMPTVMGNVLEESISSISSVEYWDIKSVGVKAGISLSWRSSSAIADLTASSLPNLTIVGWNGSAWVTIPSIIDEYSILGEISTLVSGSISSTAAVDLSAYKAFSFGTATKQLLVPIFEKIELTAYVNKNRLFIEASLPITALVIYDISGRRIFSELLNGDLKYNQPFNYADEIYIAKIELDNGTSIFTKKIINKH
jgi:hypothetical protein